MSDLTLSKKQEIFNKASLDLFPALNVAVLRNVMVEPLATILGYDAYLEGYTARVVFGEFDTIYQEAVNGRSDMLNEDTNIVLVFVHLAQESPQLCHGFATLTPQAVVDESEIIIKKASAILAGIRRQTSAMILWHSFELPVAPALGIVDSQNRDGQLAAIRRLNDEIRRLLTDTGNAFVVDMNLCLARVGAQRFYDSRYWHRSRLPYTVEALEAIADEEVKFLRPMMGRTRKCLVLDCDNVLWGGIVGEDGLSGIELDATHPGSAYQEFQKEVLNLYHRGVILGLCSKNNEDDVWEVFDKHPGMVLKREHIAAARINWLDKGTNLRQLAGDLNLGLDSFVFVDDSAFEVNLVRKTMPEVDVIHIPKESASRAREILAAYGKFDTLALSEEDQKRGAMYRAEAGRRKLQAEFTDMQSYYRSLEMEVTITFDNAFCIPRVAQQAQKTNQFNLTTRRYTEADVKGLMNSADVDVLTLSLADRLGDSGVVGTCILRYEQTDADLDTFLLSCRVLGREIEKVFLRNALRRAKQRGAKRVVGDFIKTAKGSVPILVGN